MMSFPETIFRSLPFDINGFRSRLFEPVWRARYQGPCNPEAFDRIDGSPGNPIGQPLGLVRVDIDGETGGLVRGGRGEFDTVPVVDACDTFAGIDDVDDNAIEEPLEHPHDFRVWSEAFPEVERGSSASGR